MTSPKSENELDLDLESELLNRNKDEISGKITIGCPEMGEISAITNKMEDFQKKHPKVFYDIRSSGNQREIARDLEQGITDFGLILDYLDPNIFDHYDMHITYRLGLLMKPNNKLSNYKTINVDDLDSLSIIVSSQTHERAKDLGIGILAKNISVVATYDLAYNAAAMVRSDIGVCVCLENVQKTDLTFVPFSPETKVPLMLITRKNRIMTKQSMEFLASLESVE